MNSNEESDSPLQIIHPCPGLRIDLPEGMNACLEWPWKEQAELAMAWDIKVKGNVLTIYAPTCLQSTPYANRPCHDCKTMQCNQMLGHIQDQIYKDVPETTSYKYLSTSRLIRLLR